MQTTDLENDAARVALADAIFQWPAWVSRRVDSYHPLHGARGRVKHSMDCTPPPDPRLAYDKFERGIRDIDEVSGQLMVPLAFLDKEPVRHFDTTFSDGTSFPVLESEETSNLMVSSLILLMIKSGVKPSDELDLAMNDLVRSKGETNRKKVEKLLETGMWGEKPLWIDEAEKLEIDSELQEFLLNLSTSFLLIGLIPAAHAGKRQVLKFSYHWVFDLPHDVQLNNFFTSLMVAFRFSSLELKLKMHIPDATKSYHLEFHTPAELEVLRLEFPPFVQDKKEERKRGKEEKKKEEKKKANRGALDQTGTPIAHVHSRFPKVPDGDAIVLLGVPRYRGIWLIAFLTSLFTAVVLGLALFLPGATSVLEGASGNAAALLLAAPAVFLGFLIFPKEHTFVTWMLNPLRYVVGICALMLFAMAASLVGVLKDSYLFWLWFIEFVVSVVLWIALLCGSKRRQTKDEDLKEKLQKEMKFNG